MLAEAFYSGSNSILLLNTGKAIQIQHFPEWNFNNETYLLACLLHDIGTTDKNLHATMMSFEFYGGLLALELLSKDHHAPKAQAESVAEAIIRHQDLGESGKITAVGGCFSWLLFSVSFFHLIGRFSPSLFLVLLWWLLEGGCIIGRLTRER